MRRVFAYARNTWRTLTSMGTALVLLFLLALGAIPGALLPQRSLNEFKVEQYIVEHPTIGPWLDRLQAFQVFSSFWFTAIYVLLFISLVGCLTPRLIEHARRSAPQPEPAAQASHCGGRRRFRHRRHPNLGPPQGLAPHRPQGR
jgi:cytochrome c biogenesis protein